MVLMLYRASVVNHCVQFHSSELDDLSPMLPNERRSSTLSGKNKKIMWESTHKPDGVFYVFAFGMAQSSCEGSVGMMGEWQ